MKIISLMFVTALLFVPSRICTAQAQQSAKALYQQALHEEEATGNLKAAIALYERVLSAKPDHALAAQTLIHMANCYQKLGSTESRQLYQRVVRDYSDQRDAVALARARLGTDTASRDVSLRQVWSVPFDRTPYGSVSRDGHYLAYVDWSKGGNGNLFLHDFQSNTDRPLTNTATDSMPRPDVEQFAEEHSFSRDGKQLAYSWYRENSAPGRYELRMLDLKGDGIPPSRLLVDDPDINWIRPFDWSPDGKLIAVGIQRKDKSYQIGLVSVPSGNVRVLKSADWYRDATIVFSPDGQYLAYDVRTQPNSDERSMFVLAIEGTREIPVVVSPGQNGIVGWSRDGKQLLFTSDRTGSLGLWSVPFSSGKVDGPPELLRRNIGPMLSLGLTDAGKLYMQVEGAGRDVRVAEVDFLTGKQTTPATMAAQASVDNRFPAWSPNGKYLAYVSRRGSFGAKSLSIGIRGADSGEVRDLPVSPGLDLMQFLAWPLDGLMLAKATDHKGNSGLFSIDVQSGRTSLLVPQGEEEILINVSAISSDGKKLTYGKRALVAGTAAPQPLWIEKDLTSGNQRELTRTILGGPLSPDAQYLMVSGANGARSRALSILRTMDGEVRELVPDLGPGAIAGARWSKDSRTIYVLKTSGELWQVPIDGGSARKVDIKAEGAEVISGPFSVHPDGKRVAFETKPAGNSSPGAGGEIWVLENFLKN